MNKLKMLSPLLLFLLFVSCKKKHNKQTSTWYFNGQQSTSSNVRLSETRGGSDLFVMDGDKENNVDKNKGFILQTGSGAFPSGGSCMLYNGPDSKDPSLVRLFFFNYGKQYGLSKHNAASILISSHKGLRKFELPEAWFTNINNRQDSALISATLWESN